ncbi:centromere protein F isoform X2 [Hyla sarda]|uniref:centromere protein F isoform X2 n=1 Tax=Hyla sarda TaxID=327740 RepID=UPI0024C3FB1A|nr:centromere protein F isoform X2 [Hyla sarda]
MSWVVEEWKEGLPTKTLQKIQELESQLDKLKKERQQRQFQLESLEAAFQKQKQKVECEKGEITALKRENQSLIELCDNQEKTRQKLSHEQQVKDTQINFLEGQLSASKKNIEKLEQELKRYKNDLERSQQSFNGADMSICVTPQKSLTASFTPVKFNDCKYEELQEKYNKEVTERKRLETELKILQIKLVNQTSQPAPQNTMNHRDIARHQSSSSVFSWQQERTPSRPSSSSHDTSLKRNYTSIHYPWEQEETPSKRGLKSEGLNRSFCESSNNPANGQLRNQNQELRDKVTELELRLQVQEKELKSHLHKLQETQTLLDKSQAELVEKDKTLTKSRDDLARVTVHLEQSAEKCSSTEQKLKKVSEELSCQRQNAESARLTLEQKLKEREKENQQELLRSQNSLKDMEQQLNQMKTKLSLESQQAKNEFNAMQAELDRATHGKKILEQEVEDLRQKLCRAEQSVTTSQNHVTDLKKNLEEARSQQNAIRSQLDQKTKENLKLEEEFRTANQTLRQNQVFIDELKNKNNSLDVEIKAALQKLKNQDLTSLENLKATTRNLEKERDFAKELLQKRENNLTEMNNAQEKMSEELLTLKNELHCKEQVCKDLMQWKHEHDKNTTTSVTEKEETSKKFQDLERTVQNLKDQTTLLENDKRNLHTQIKTLQDIIEVRTADLEVQKVNIANLDSQRESETQRYQKEIKDLLQKITELEALSAESSRVSFLEKELDIQKNLKVKLQDEHEHLLRSQQEIRVKVEGMRRGCLTNSTGLQDVSSEPLVDLIISVIREKEEEISKLFEQLSSAKAETESACQNNKEITAKLQSSWSAERETLAASINSLQNDLEKLTEENKRMAELCNKCETTQLKRAKMDTSERNFSDNTAENNLIDESREENANQYEKLKGNVEEMKEKIIRVQQENGRLLRANEEMSSLIGKLRDNELSLNKTLEELRVCLKDKETSLRNAQTKIESMSTSCTEKESSAERVRESLIVLQSPPDRSKRDNGSTVMKAPESKKENVLHSLDETMLDGNSDRILMDNSLLDITGDISLFAPSVGSQNREENLTLLINMDQLTLASANDTTLPLPDLSQLESLKCSALSPFISPPIKERVDGKGDRKSITSEIVDLLLESPPQQQRQVVTPGDKSNECAEVKDLLMVYQMELSRLQKQHLSEIAVWQQKLEEQATEMEAKLSAEKAEAERLAQELEAARLELQVFDLSARSLLSFDNDDLTSRLDAANQTLCTVLPIERLSLGNCELQTHGHLKQSPRVERKSVDENITEMVHNGSPKEQEEDIEKPSRKSKRKKGRSGGHVDKRESQDVSEDLQLQAEEKKLCQLLKEREEINVNLVAEIKDLSGQIERLKAELLKKDQEKQDLDDKSKTFEVERLELLGEIELISSEKSRSANKIAQLEKELNNSLNGMEILKEQISELSSIRDSLEISGKEWKESYLQTESELRRAKSEKANIENHALSLEADLDVLQSKCQRLQEESEGNLRFFNEIRENLNTVEAEKSQLSQDLESLFEEKEELEQMYKNLKGREQELESGKSNSKELIKILEEDLRTLKGELQAAKLTAEQFVAERDCMYSLQEKEKMQIQELENQIERILEEKKVLVNEREDLQTQISSVQEENEKLSRSLERCQGEKHELGSSLSSAQEEVTLMRTGIEKLKVKIEADEKKKSQSMNKLKESERKFDKLNDQIESLERELQMSEENLEHAILQAEVTKEELEGVTEQKEALEVELKCLRQKIEELERELHSSREKMVELEATIAAITKTLEDREIEHTQLMDNSKKQQDLFQAELENLLTQKAISDQRCESAMAECADVSSKMKQHKEQLLQELEEAQVTSKDLETSLQKLTSEHEECKRQLDEKTRQLEALESRSEDAEQIEMRYSTEIARFEVECENLKNKNKILHITLENLEEKLRTVSAENETLQSTIACLKTSCSDLEAQMESTNMEKKTLLNKVGELEDNCCGLQSKLQDADLHIKSIQERNSREQVDQDEEMQAIRRQHEDSSAQLLTATSEAAEMKASIASLQKELESQAKKHEDDIMEYEKRLLQADSSHQSLLDEMRKKNGDLVCYREQLTSLETHLNAHKQEIDRLKAANGELNESLCKAQEQLAELRQLKVNLYNLTKKNAKTCSDLSQWMKSCEELKEEKQQLQRQIQQQEETLRGLTQKHRVTDMNPPDDDLLSEIEELKQSLEEKTLEADESVEKYCNLMIKTHKLEDTNETLRMQVDVLSARLKEMEAEKGEVVEAKKGEVGEAKKGEVGEAKKGEVGEAKKEEVVETMKEEVGEAKKEEVVEAEKEEVVETMKEEVGETHQPSLPGEAKKRRKSRQSSQRKQAGKRRRDSENTSQTPSTPQAVTKRIKKTASRSLEDEFDPEGLPEVVKKGFADIPSGKQSPFVLRRTAVPLRRSPRLPSQTNSPSILNARTDSLENIPTNSPTPGGSKSHLTKPTEDDSVPMDVPSPLSAYDKRKAQSSDNFYAHEPEKEQASAKLDETEEEGACQVQ